VSARLVGIEEELLLVDPGTGGARSHARRVLDGHDDLDQELFQHQIETQTEPTSDLGEASVQLVAARRSAGEAARSAGLAAVAVATSPYALDPHVSPSDRYRDMLETYGGVARTAGTCGMHVHVAIDSPEQGVAVLDRIAPWLPTLLAVSANSPYADGADTGYASWRSQVWSRWPSAGPTEAFGSLAGYREVCRQMLASGAARDDGMLYFDARLSAHQPTVEVRVLDVCTDPADAVLAAALVRGLVETAARAGSAGLPAPTWRTEALRAAQWRAARFGLAGSLVHPLEHRLAPARDVLGALVDRVGPALREAGDTTLVEDGAERVLAATGSARQRAAFERTGGLPGVLADLVARTESSWGRDSPVVELSAPAQT
jgi:carboxylate-amine ligase